MNVGPSKSAGLRVSLMALVITSVAAGSLVVAAMVGRPVPHTVVPHIGIATTVVSLAETTQNQSATLTIKMEPVREVGAGTGQGMVSAIHIDVGDELTQGTPLFDVNGQRVWALLSETPVYRDIRYRDRGPDVAALQDFLLTQIEFTAPNKGTVDQATVSAIRAWQRETGQARTGIAEAARFVWLPKEFTVSESNLVLGHPLPAPGAALFTESNLLGTLTIAAEQPVDPGQYAVIVVAQKVPVTLGDDQEWTFDDPQDLGKILALHTKPTEPGADQSQTLGLKDLIIEGRIERALPIVGVAVPAASVIDSQSGAGSCVWELQDATNVKHEGVQILASVASGAVIVAQESAQGELPGVAVILDPTNQVPDPVCP